MKKAISSSANNYNNLWVFSLINIIIINSAIIAFLLISISCSRQNGYPDNINDILDRAGANRKELEVVIEHYKKNPADSLKLKSAYFLIENIDGLQTLDTSLVHNDMYFNALDKSFKKNKKKLDLSMVSIIIDSLNQVKKLNPIVRSKYVDELHIVSGEFLINNIESSFKVWRTMPWAKHISFETFCEYILPYRSTDTYSNDGRNILFTKYKGILDSLKTTNPFKASEPVMLDIDKWFTDDGQILRRYPYLKPMKFNDLLKGRIGECIDATSIRVAALRSIGIPVALDQIPNWGNSNASHFWYKIIDPTNDTITKLLTNKQIPGRTDHIVSASTYVWETPVDGYPKDVMMNYVRTVPKVYRQCFSKQNNSLAELKGKGDEIPPYFTNNRLKDVTDEYVECKDVIKTVPVNGLAREKFMYLCVFDNKGWKPVAWSAIKNRKALFKNVGKNIVYMPAYYKNEQIIPAGKPFLLNSDGIAMEINSNGKKEKIKLYTKYPYRSFVNLWQSYMIKGSFQFGNEDDYSDSITVHRIKQLPFYSTEVKIKTSKNFRYALYQFRDLPATCISNLEFWGINGEGVEIKLSGNFIGNAGKFPFTKEKAIDNNRSSYFTPRENDETYIGFDFGSKYAVKITKIKFTPRNDDNAIVPNVKYELFLWENKWISLGIQTGNEDKTVIFKNIPLNALLLLKDNEGGTENRIFTYNNNTQRFW